MANFFVKLFRKDGSEGKSVPSTHPAARSQKFVEELKTGKRKYDGKPLERHEKAWRAGYMAARQDAAKQHKFNSERANKKGPED